MSAIAAERRRDGPRHNSTIDTRSLSKTVNLRKKHTHTHTNEKQRHKHTTIKQSHTPRGSPWRCSRAAPPLPNPRTFGRPRSKRCCCCCCWHRHHDYPDLICHPLPSCRRRKHQSPHATSPSPSSTASRAPVQRVNHTTHISSSKSCSSTTSRYHAWRPSC